MKLPSLWSSSQDLMSDPIRSIRREMEDMLRTFDRHLPSLRVGAGTPAINVAETKDAMEVTIEVPGVDEKDIKVSLDGNQLVISGEKKEETKKDEKDWHVEERSYGSLDRSMSLPFRPDEGAIEAHLDKGVLHLNIKKPAEDTKSVKYYRDQTWHTYEGSWVTIILDFRYRVGILKDANPARSNSFTLVLEKCAN